MEIRRISQQAFLDWIEGRDQNNAYHSYILIFVTIIYVESPELGSREQIHIYAFG